MESPSSWYFKYRNVTQYFELTFNEIIKRRSIDRSHLYRTMIKYLRSKPGWRINVVGKIRDVFLSELVGIGYIEDKKYLEIDEIIDYLLIKLGYFLVNKFNEVVYVGTTGPLVQWSTG